MKKFEVYKNIRKKAVIFGLPISLFALQMVAILASLLVIIFSFSFVMIIGILVFNAVLYVALTHITNNPQLFQMAKVFPKIISNKRNSGFDYEQN
jgi:type IV secretory pathway VirB3-like protein